MPGEVLELGEDVQAEELMLVSEVNYFPVFQTCQVKLELVNVPLKVLTLTKFVLIGFKGLMR